MSSTTPNLGLPYLAAAQAQKHVTHNQAIRALDAMVQLAVVSRDLAAPPASPAEGHRYLVAAGATGAWSGFEGWIAAYQDAAWTLLMPQVGWLVWVAAESLLLAWDGAAWVHAVVPTALNPAALVGINATADTTNRLAVKSPASLFDHVGAGHQLKINKASAADTGSVLFQDGYAGHAEMGLTGDDNFHVKVSADGTAWANAIVIDKATGSVSLPNTSLASPYTLPVASASALGGIKPGANVAVAGDGTLSVAAPFSGSYADLAGKPSLGSAAAANVGTSAGNVVALDGSAKLPAVDGSQLTNLPSAPSLAVESSGSQITAAAARMNFAGAGVSAAYSGGKVVVTIPGTGGSGNVPSGGSASQVLAKKSAADFDTTWATPPVATIEDANSLGLDFAIPDANGQVAFGILPNGKAVLDLDPSSRGYGTVVGLVALGGKAIPDDSATAPNSLNLVWGIEDAAGHFSIGIKTDGTFFMAKPPADVKAAALAASVASEQMLDVQGGQIAIITGTNRQVLTTSADGTNDQPSYAAGNLIKFRSTRYRSLPGVYTMNLDGSNQRRALGTPAWEGVFITGQSNSMGQAGAVSTTAAYPGNAYKWVSGPVTNAGANISAAVTTPLVELSTESPASAFASRTLDAELAQRSGLKLFLFGSGYAGTAYSGIKQGTATYNSILDQATKLVANAAPVIVRGFLVEHGETDAGNTSYDANLIEWRNNFDTDIKAITGQKQDLFLFISQIQGTYGYQAQSNLKILAASQADARIVLACADYIFSYIDSYHLDAASQKLLGEYFSKAFQKVCYEGRDWVGVRPKTTTIVGNTIVVDFDVQVAPLVLDTYFCTDPGNYGFGYSDASGRTISSVAVTGPKQITITLSGAPGTSAVLKYAWDNWTTASTSGATGLRGCLRDSDPAVSRFDATKHLYNPCAVFKIALN